MSLDKNFDGLSKEELGDVKGGIPYEKPGLEDLTENRANCYGGTASDSNCLGGSKAGAKCTGGSLPGQPGDVLYPISVDPEDPVSIAGPSDFS